jgi:membrane-bound lytic murein transglycosylase MltF
VLLPLPAVAAPVPDLPEIRARGALRVLVVGDEAEPPIQRDGTPAALDRDLAEDFARRQGLKLEIVWIERRHDVIGELLGGRGTWRPPGSPSPRSGQPGSPSPTRSPSSTRSWSAGRG